MPQSVRKKQIIKNILNHHGERVMATRRDPASALQNEETHRKIIIFSVHLSIFKVYTFSR